jgi:CheY-like chemotaxis protein
MVMPAKKIVLSDDAALLAILKNSFFQREGFELILARDGQTGFQAVEIEAPALVVFDLSLLGEQALDSCRAIKSDPLLATTPVMLLLPDKAPEDLADDCWHAGCDAVVHRPLAAERLLDAACELLGISHRLARRFPVKFQLEFQDNKQKKHVGICVNLNSGGLFIATESLFPVNTNLILEFCLPGSNDSLNIPARVAWVNHPEWLKKGSLPFGLGVQFITPELAVRIRLDAFLDTQNEDCEILESHCCAV